MANVLTDLAADIYKAADTVGRELVGVIPSITINTGSEGAAIGQTVRSHFTREATAGDMTPAMTIPEGTDQTVDNKTLTLTKQRGVAIPWTGEDIRFVQGGSGYETIYGDQIAQAMRTLTNEVEADVATEAYTNASRAVGTAGTTPFASNYDLVAEAEQVMADNGMPTSDGRLSMIINPAAATKMKNLSVLNKVNESGDSRLLRQGVLGDLGGFGIRRSAQIQAHTKGAGVGYDINNGSGEAVGQTTLTLDGGTVNTTGIKAGDVVTFAGDTNNYVVNAGLVATGGDIVIGSPGLMAAVADTTEMTIGNSYAANLALHQSAVELAMRPFAKPFGGDAAVDVMQVQDPHSGLVFEVSVYKGFNKVMIYVGAVWGYKAWKQDAIVAVMG
ncbi:MAG: P22 phage major capsid protein family protein [Pikeienuella sp.]